MKNYVLVGYSGLTGSEILKNLNSDPSVSSILCIGRKKVQLESSKIKFVQISSLASLKELAQLPKDAHWICCLGTTIKTAGSKEAFIQVDLTAVVDFANLAKMNHCKTLSIISAAGANKSSSIFYNQVKGQMEDLVRGLDLPRVNIFRPGLLIGDRPEFRLGEKIMIQTIKRLQNIIPEKLTRRIATPIDRLAEKVINEIKSDSTGFRVIESHEI